MNSASNIKKIFFSVSKYVKQIFAIYYKEVFQIILSPMFFVILGVSCLLWGANYCNLLFNFAEQSRGMRFGGGGGGNIHYSVFLPFISQLNLLMVFIAPALTMRLFAEEKKQNTYDLLLSAPLTSTQIVLGKFFAAYKALGIIIFVSTSYIFLTAFFADFNWWMPFISYIGVLLTVGAYVALSLFASTLTSSVVLSVILGVIFNLFLWYIGLTVELINNEWFTVVMEYLSVSRHLINFAKGTVVISSIAFFGIIILFFTFLAKQMVEISRWK